MLVASAEGVTKPNLSKGANALVSMTKSKATSAPLKTVSPPASKPIPRIQTPIEKPRPKNGKHLILDLDETLVHTFDPGDNLQKFIEKLSQEDRKRIYHIEFPGSDSLWGFIRPGAQEFLRMAFSEFESVGVWSAGADYYVHMIVELVFKEQQPVFVMTRNECNELRVKYEETPCRYKPLEVVYHKYPDHNEQNTVIVDDRHDICAYNCMNNIRIPEFKMDDMNYTIAAKDRTLEILANWMKSDEFRSAKDVRLIKSKSPFKI